MSNKTEEADLKNFEEECGIAVTSVQKLKPREKWQERTSAFRVIIALSCKDSVMDPNLWPESVEVRDWLFKQS